MSKTRVAPVKELTLPQLELMAAVIGARLTRHLLSALECKSATLWSDSQIVLQWLKSTKPLKRFISNRVKEIHDLTASYEWKYCSTTVNPADLLTRGITSQQLKSNTLWINGPRFLVKDGNEMQHSNFDTSLSLLVEETESEEEKLSTDNNDQHIQIGIHVVMDLKRYGSYRKLLNVTAYVLRFIENCKNRRDSRKTGSLKHEEVQKSSILWIKNCQESAFMTEICALKSEVSTRKKLPRISQLRLFLDENELLRCKGRIHNAPLPQDTYYQRITDFRRWL